MLVTYIKRYVSCRCITVVSAGHGGRRPSTIRRRPGGHRHRLGIHYRRHGPYSSRYRSRYPHRSDIYGRSPIQDSYHRTARPVSAAPGGACRVSFNDNYTPPEYVVCRCCISLNYEYCIRYYYCREIGTFGRSRLERSRHRSYRSRLGDGGKKKTTFYSMI